MATEIIKNVKQNLSRREKECFIYLLQGYTAKKMAKSLNLSNRTIEVYINNIKNKTGIHKTEEIIYQAFREGFLKIDF